MPVRVTVPMLSTHGAVPEPGRVQVDSRACKWVLACAILCGCISMSKYVSVSARRSMST